MSDKMVPLGDPPPDPAAATGSVDLTVDQTKSSHSYQHQSRPLPPSDLDVAGRSSSLGGSQSREDLPGPETVHLCQSVEPSDSSSTLEMSSSSWYEEKVETTSNRIASTIGPSSSESTPVLSPVSVAMESDEFSYSVTEFTPNAWHKAKHWYLHRTDCFFFPLWHCHLWRQFTGIAAREGGLHT